MPEIIYCENVYVGKPRQGEFYMSENALDFFGMIDTY